MGSNYKRQISSYGSLGILALFLFPLIVFIFKSPSLSLPSSFQWLEVLYFTLLQSSLSALLALVLGVAGALGLSVFSHHKYRGSLELFCLLPALLPSLIVVLSWINISELFFRFPFGFYSILAVHVLMSIGLISVYFSRLFYTQTGGLSQWAYLHHLSRWSFLKKLIFFEFRRDMQLMFLLIFAFCFTSFSVPLLVGGVEGQTLEVFIAEKLKQPAYWPEALFLFMVETGFVFLFFSLIYMKNNFPRSTSAQQKKPYLLPSLPFICLPLLPALFIFLGLSGGLPWRPLFSNSLVWQELSSISSVAFSSWLHTLFVGIGTGLTVFLLFSSVAWFLRSLFLRKFFLAYTGASTAFMGFAFLIVGGDSTFEVGFKWCLGLSLLFLPALYRLMGESTLMRLKNQVDLVDLMGASRFLSFFKIILPQCTPAFLFLSGVAAFWACGDFAYSSIVAGDKMHLALLIQDMFFSYRLELATILTWFLILSGALCFSFFAGVAFVLHQKSCLQTR